MPRALCRAALLPFHCSLTSELSSAAPAPAAQPGRAPSPPEGEARPQRGTQPGPAPRLTSLTAASPRAQTAGPGHELPGSAAGPEVPHRGRRLSQSGHSVGDTAAGGHRMDRGQVRVRRGSPGATRCALLSLRSPRSPCRQLRRCPANHCLTLPHVPVDVFIAMGGNCRPRST